MKTKLILLFAIMLAACSAESAPSDEPPFYAVDRNGTGPLTMEELQVDLPAELEAMYTDEMEACLFANIEELAADAGDPETLDPAAVAFLPTDGTWDDLTRQGRRGLLAQAIISRAATLC